MLVTLGSASVMILAFFLPAVQDQWDRYQSRKIIEQYVVLGDSFLIEERYEMAEEAYGKAFHLSDDKRLDIEMKRLHAKIEQINMDPEWGSKSPSDLEDIDFQFLLHMQSNIKQRASTLNSYGIFLASEGKVKDAEESFIEAIRLDSMEAQSHVNYGNLLDQLGKKDKAKQHYLKAIRLDPENGRAHYNLGLLYLELGSKEEAEKQFKRALQIDPDDADAQRELGNIDKARKE